LPPFSFSKSCWTSSKFEDLSEARIEKEKKFIRISSKVLFTTVQVVEVLLDFFEIRRFERSENREREEIHQNFFEGLFRQNLLGMSSPFYGNTISGEITQGRTGSPLPGIPRC